MKTVGIYEAKIKLSEICETVSKTKEPLLITRRGIPLVRIDPIHQDANNQSKIWNLRKEFITKNGEIDEDLVLPKRSADLLKQIF